MAENKTNGTILVVDDEESVRAIVSIALKNAGYSVVSAVDGKEALELISRRKFDLVFLDVRMPGFNGHDILTLMRASCPQMPVVMLTAVIDKEIEAESIRRGASAYLKKPCALKDIVATAKQELERKTAKEALRSNTLAINASVSEESRQPTSSNWPEGIDKHRSSLAELRKRTATYIGNQNPDSVHSIWKA